MLFRSRAALIPCVLQLLALSTAAFAQDPVDNVNPIPTITPETPAPSLDTTTPGGPALQFGFDTVVLRAIGPNGKYQNIINDPDYRGTLMQMLVVYTQLNKDAHVRIKTPPAVQDRPAVLNELSNRWASALRRVLNSDLKAQLWRPLIQEVKAHIPKASSSGVKLDLNIFEHRATVYHELAVGIKVALKAYDDREDQIEQAKASGLLPNESGGHYSDVLDSGSTRCRKRRRCALELLF